MSKTFQGTCSECGAEDDSLLEYIDPSAVTPPPEGDDQPAPTDAAAVPGRLLLCGMCYEGKKEDIESHLCIICKVTSTPARHGVCDMCRASSDCVQCGQSLMGCLVLACADGPLHNECIEAYKKTRAERCVHCKKVLGTKRIVWDDKKFHPDCVEPFKQHKPVEVETKQGPMKKFSVGHNALGKTNWTDRYFVIDPSEGGQLLYFENEAAFEESKAKKKPARGAVPLGQPTTRLLSRPTRLQHPEAMEAHKEILLYFVEKEKAGLLGSFAGGLAKVLKGGDDKEERMLLLSCPTWQDHDEWVRVLSLFVPVVDHPDDVSSDRHTQKTMERYVGK